MFRIRQFILLLLECRCRLNKVISRIGKILSPYIGSCIRSLRRKQKKICQYYQITNQMRNKILGKTITRGRIKMFATGEKYLNKASNVLIPVSFNKFWRNLGIGIWKRTTHGWSFCSTWLLCSGLCPQLLLYSVCNDLLCVVLGKQSSCFVPNILILFLLRSAWSGKIMMASKIWYSR